MWQSVNNEVLLSWFKFQAKISSRSGVCLLGEWQKYTPPFPPPFKDEALKNIGHSMSIRNLIFGVNNVTVSYLIRYDSLLQNTTDLITKCGNYFITKYDRNLLQNALGFLLQSATVLLQNATVIAKCDVYYKLWQYNCLSEIRLISFFILLESVLFVPKSVLFLL